MKKVILSVITMINVCVASSNFVTVCKLDDQFGGQLFFTAMALGFAWENDLTPVFSKATFLNAPNGPLNYEYFFSRFEKFIDEKDPKIFNHPSHHEPAPYKYADGNLCLCNVRTEKWYFDKFREKIREEFSPSEKIINFLQNKYPNILEAKNTVAVHIRTYHPVRCQNHLFLGEEYYKKAMNMFDDSHLFVIFSDRINWCKNHFKGFKPNMLFIEDNNHITDLFLMSFCNNIIASNSTFSWWAAYLKQTTDGRILVPSMWSAIEYYQLHESDVIKRGLYLSDWEILPVTNIPSPVYSLLEFETTSVREKD